MVEAMPEPRPVRTTTPNFTASGPGSSWQTPVASPCFRLLEELSLGSSDGTDGDHGHDVETWFQLGLLGVLAPSSKARSP